MVIAYNSKGQKQVFNDFAWKMLGVNKGDWKERSVQSIENTIEVAKRPDMGPPIAPPVQKIENTIGKTEEEVLDSTGVNKMIEKPELKKEEFLKSIEGFSRSAIKDFFDQQTPAVAYKNMSKDAQLKKQLAEYLNYDMKALQKAFI